jgi:hypothetical protein
MTRFWAAALLAGTTFTATGCVGWRQQAAPPAQVIADPEVQVVRVTRRDNTTQVVYQPRIDNDTLSGLPTELAVNRVAIPLADVTAVATRYRHIGKTLLAGIAIAGGVALYGLLQSLNSF